MVAGPEDASQEGADQTAPASTTTTETEPEAKAESATIEPEAKADSAHAEPEAKTASDTAEPEPSPEPPPPDPDACRGLAISQEAFEAAVLRGEFDESDYLFYLEPAGVTQASLVCTRRYPAENLPAGILMTKAARDAKVVYFDDTLNPEKYELSFPKEFGYVKSIQHYVPASREHAKYPWSKKY